MKTREEISELLERLLNDDMDLEERQYILTLISENAYIKNEYDLRKKIDDAIQNSEVIEFRNKLNKLVEENRIDNTLEEPRHSYSIKWYHAAAIIIILGGLTYIISSLTSKKNDFEQLISNEQLINPNDKPILQAENRINEKEQEVTTPPPNMTGINDKTGQSQTEISETQLLLALNFEKSEYFESFIDNFRTGHLEINSPLSSSTYSHGSEILFKWSQIYKDSLYLKLFTNREINIFTIQAKHQFLFREKLGPGLYYWKLESEDDLLYMNKFTIIK